MCLMYWRRWLTTDYERTYTYVYMYSQVCRCFCAVAAAVSVTAPLTVCQPVTAELQYQSR